MKRKILILLIMIPMILAMTSCGFVVEEESIEIKSITHEVLEDGQIKVIISYTNEDIEPSIFYVPKGIDGQIGVGIENIEVKEADKVTTTLAITLSDGTIKDVVVPNGVSIIDTKEVTENGVRYIVFQFSDNTEKRFELIKGDKGTDGLNVVDVVQEEILDPTNSYFGYIKVTFTFSDGTEENTYKKDVYVRPGQAGNGIASIKEDFDDEFYYITFFYTDDSKDPYTVKFPIPQVVEWSSGEGRPNNSNGKNGDFYFDTKNGVFYKKINDIWTDVCTVPNPEGADELLITLNKNADDALLDESLIYITVAPNSNVATTGSSKTLPIPYRTGYEFAGWYATQTPNINSGVFTDLTIVTQSVTLYAKWVELK